MLIPSEIDTDNQGSDDFKLGFRRVLDHKFLDKWLTRGFAEKKGKQHNSLGDSLDPLGPTTTFYSGIFHFFERCGRRQLCCLYGCSKRTSDTEHVKGQTPAPEFSAFEGEDVGSLPIATRVGS